MDEVEQRARTMGWVPKDEFRNKELWVDADTFVRRGEEITPILKANNRKLESDMARIMAENAKLAQMVAAGQESITALTQFHEDNLKRALAEQKKRLAAELSVAREEGDTLREVEIQDELAGLRQPVSAPAPKPVTPPTPQAPQVDPDILAWQQANASWFGVDARRTKQAIGVANMIEADNPELVGAAFTAELTRRLANNGAPVHSKVGGSTPSGQGGGGGGGSGGYSSLPADAKDACDRQGRKLVGEGKAFKDQASWQAYYAKIYYQGEQ